MSTNHTIFQSLKNHFSFNKSRLKVLSCLIVGIIRSRDVNLVKLASYQSSDATEPLLGYSLAIDRTNWKFGKTHINILTVGIVIGKVSIPLVWSTLPQTSKRGNSNTKQRIALMNRVLKVLPAKDIYCFTMDREFNGDTWLKWLDEKGIAYVLRLRKNNKVNGVDAKNSRSTRQVKKWERKEVFGLQLYFACKFIKKGRADYLYVVSNTFSPLEALEIYKSRCSIEVLFGHLKKKGFNLENTHMSDREKINKLVAVLALAFLFTLGWGLLLKENRTLSAYQKRKSVFRLALDLLNSMFSYPSKHKEKIKLFEQWLNSEISPSIFVV